jgi:hypothetical protein
MELFPHHYSFLTDMLAHLRDIITSYFQIWSSLNYLFLFFFSLLWFEMKHSKVEGAYCLGVFQNGKDPTTLLGGN